jgi:hypothetical protein
VSLLGDSPPTAVVLSLSGDATASLDGKENLTIFLLPANVLSAVVSSILFLSMPLHGVAPLSIAVVRAVFGVDFTSSEGAVTLFSDSSPFGDLSIIFLIFVAGALLVSATDPVSADDSFVIPKGETLLSVDWSLSGDPSIAIAATGCKL